MIKKIVKNIGNTEGVSICPPRLIFRARPLFKFFGFLGAKNVIETQHRHAGIHSQNRTMCNVVGRDAFAPKFGVEDVLNIQFEFHFIID